MVQAGRFGAVPRGRAEIFAMTQRTSTLILIATMAILIAVLGIGVITPAQPEKVDINEWGSMRLCVADTIVRTGANTTSVDLLEQATSLCYRHLHGQGLLNDFKIRRLKFIQQTYDERVLLWMVVVITLSGVFLAGLQLLASFKLASIGSGNFDQQTEMSIEQGKLSVKSSLTGLLILICSFAFFWVFVYEVFVMKVVDPDAASGKQGNAMHPNGQVGSALITPLPAPTASALGISRLRP